MVLSAADLQKQLEGAPDPFPGLDESSQNPTASTSNSAPLNTNSETLFPSLAAPSTSKAPTSSWTVRAVKPVSTPVYTDSFALTGIDPSASHTKDGKPRSLGDIVKDIQTKHKVKVDVFSQRTSNQTTFTVTGASDTSVEAAKRAITTSLSPVITLAVQTPVSVVGSIVGSKGANLKRIRDLTSTKIDIPRRDNLAVPNANGQENSRSPSPYPTSPADENEATIRITITGPASMAHEAQAMIQAIITEKTSRSVQKIKVTPSHVYPFVLNRRADFLKVANGAELNLTRDDQTKEITVNGDREAVGKVIESIRSCMAFYEGDLTSVKITLPRRQHHLLTGKAHDDIFQKSKCNVVIPDPEDPSEDVQVWGKATSLGAGLQAVMERANSQHTRSLPIPGGYPRHILTHLDRSGYGKTFGNSHPNVTVHFPPVSVVGQATIDFSGERAPVDLAYKELAAHLALLDGATRNIPVDYLLHNILNAKAAKQLKNYHGSKNTLVYFPPESDADSNILLVYDPHAAQPVKNKQAVLAEIEAEILGHVAGLGQIKTETVSVERKWHPAVTGKNGSTLNALIGEGRALSIEVGGNGQEDIVVIRGTPDEVDRATKDILMIVEEAKNDATASSYSTEFYIPQQFVARIVGAAGAGIQKYREQLDVKIDIDDSRDSGEQIVGKKKKASPTQSLIRITGRKQNAEEAKKRILAQVDKMADETMEVLKIPRQYHSSIIGQQGKYIQRLQDKYGVKINIGKDANTDEVQIRGGKKGVSQAKNEIQELVEYEKENNHTITVEVSSRAIPRILGAKGAKVHEIMAETDAHIDVNDGYKDKSKGSDEAGPASITIRGTKKAVAAAKTAVLAIANAVDDEITVVLHIEPKFHRTIIGGGGVGLKNLLARVGAPSDPKEQAGLVRFPQNGDEVTIRGESKLVKKIQAEIERVVTGLRERVVLGVVIPAQQHRMLIGHGGQPLMELERRTGAEVQFPGSRSYNQVAPAENAAELEDADPKNVVKVVGPRAACEKAIAELLESVAKAPNRERREQNRERTSSGPVATVQVPFKHYHLLRPTGNLIRDLRTSGVQFSQAGRPKHEGDGAASRIDDEVEVDSHGVEWKALAYGAGAEDGATDVTLKARDEESLEKAQGIIADALAKADEITHIGYMTFPDRSAFPRIIGNKGSVINDLSFESGTEIIVPKDDTTVKIYGTEDAINKAKAAITRVAFGRGRRNDD